tara:strand:- start:320 stop:1381 length:1062 start_codon:yes stop_codon:yes gene_type:complete
MNKVQQVNQNISQGADAANNQADAINNKVQNAQAGLENLQNQADQINDDPQAFVIQKLKEKHPEKLRYINLAENGLNTLKRKLTPSQNKSVKETSNFYIANYLKLANFFAFKVTDADVEKLKAEYESKISGMLKFQDQLINLLSSQQTKEAFFKLAKINSKISILAALYFGAFSEEVIIRSRPELMAQIKTIVMLIFDIVLESVDIAASATPPTAALVSLISLVSSGLYSLTQFQKTAKTILQASDVGNIMAQLGLDVLLKPINDLVNEGKDSINDLKKLAGITENQEEAFKFKNPIPDLIEKGLNILDSIIPNADGSNSGKDEVVVEEEKKLTPEEIELLEEKKATKASDDA